MSIKVEEIVPHIVKQKDELKAATKKISILQKKLWHMQIPELRSQIQMCGSIPALAVLLTDIHPEDIREVAQTLLGYKPGIYWIGTRT